MGALAYRVLGALALDPWSYEYVESRRSSTGGALLVVVASGLAAALGAGGAQGPTVMILILFAGTAVTTWLAWAGLLLYVGGVIMPERQTRVTYGELVRTTGFAAAPGLLQVFAMFPTIAVPVFIGSWLWTLAALTVAVRQALDFQSTWRAIAVCLVTFCLVLTTTVALMLAFQARVS